MCCLIEFYPVRVKQVCHVKVNFQNPRRLNWPEIIKIKSYRGSLSLPLFMFLQKNKCFVLFFFMLLCK